MDYLSNFFTNVDLQEFIRVGWAAQQNAATDDADGLA